MKSFIYAVIAMSCCAAAAETATWANVTPNTPDTAYEWSDPNNWQDGKVGGEGDDVTLPDASVYIRLPDGALRRAGCITLLHRLICSAAISGCFHPAMERMISGAPN